MKKIIVLLMGFMMIFSMTACSGETESGDKKQTAAEQGAIIKVKSAEELSKTVLNEVATVESGLASDFEKLTSDIDSYDKYIEKIDEVEAFYGYIYETTVNLDIRLREYVVDYAEVVMKSGKSYDEKYDAMEDIYDCIYEDAGDEAYDVIYEGIMEDMYDFFYDGVIEGGYDSAPYEEWLDVSSDAYDMWLDTGSDIYDELLDCRSDIYDFLLDVNGEIWDGDEERAKQKIEEFKADIDMLKEAQEQN